VIVKQMSFKSEVKRRRSERWWERSWWLWWGDMRSLRGEPGGEWIMRLMEWRMEWRWFHR